MVVSVDPVPDVLTGTVQLRPNAAEDVRNLPSNKLLDVLVRTVVVRAIGDRCLQTKGANPGTD